MGLGYGNFKNNNQMKKIIALAGSNSQDSINKRLLSHATGLLEKIEVIHIDLNDYVLPIYGVDFEAENGVPTAVKRLNDLFNGADGFVIGLAEHNGSYTAVFKNTLDWLSRVNMKVWREKPMFLLATSPGVRGGATVLQTAVSYFPFLGGNVVAYFSLPSFHENFLDEGITDPALSIELTGKLQLFEQELDLA